MKLRIRVEIFNQNLIYWVNSSHMNWYEHIGDSPKKDPFKDLFNKISDIREYFSKYYIYQKATK